MVILMCFQLFKRVKMQEISDNKMEMPLRIKINMVFGVWIWEREKMHRCLNV
ncbi:unnamed protein product [Paramecium octaurelia]|uniref:Uncharacterized protein n=1 Tax=Paramecium octaurelia TaxID=43137 RepID=A0A8S1XJE9_PAROT|nr:unnamed protein product [Paramecium octaurelia]